MRPSALVVLAMFVFMSPGLVTYAEAQRHGMGGGAPGGPHISAPAPRISAPAPRVSAPHFAVPHAGTPASRIAVPRIATPHVGTQRFSAPHVAAPHAVSRRFTAPHIAVPRRAPPTTAVGRFSPRGPGGLARHNVGPPLSNSARTVGRVHTQALAPSTAQQVRGNPRTEPGGGSRQHCPRQPCDPRRLRDIRPSPGRRQSQSGAKWAGANARRKSRAHPAQCNLRQLIATQCRNPGFDDVDVPRTVCAVWLRTRAEPAPPAPRHRARPRRSAVLALCVRRFHRLYVLTLRLRHVLALRLRRPLRGHLRGLFS